MALFSRKKDQHPDDGVGGGDDSAVPDAAPAASEQVPEADTTPAPDVTVPDVTVEAVPAVGISTTAFRGLGSQHPSDAPAAAAPTIPVRTPRPPAEAPAPTETVPGLKDNVLLRHALAQLAEQSTPQDLIHVGRALLQGHLFLRIKGDARTLVSEGKDLPLGIATVDGKPYVLAYSSGAALSESVAADGDTDTSAMGQPVTTVLRYALGGTYEGLIIDHASAPRRAILPREFVQRIIDSADPQLTLKKLLAAPRTPETAAEVAAALTTAPIWVAVNTGPDGRTGIAETRMTDGARYVEVYSHPIEVAGTGRSDKSAAIPAAKLAELLRTDATITGVLVDPAGPWIQLERADLGPLLAVTEPSDGEG
ncbi:SseB family protein [Microbacterium fluvii]|uniref:SseB family protein n=1 Tax=Microbacterium fluvii TaxID=415215 RepID=A0ABW2H9F7_9MICO|nr:SseB family protein [Microbacterium fluvii]MCU4671291.1 SseB family protein [Microbacterium fluvii]